MWGRHAKWQPPRNDLYLVRVPLKSEGRKCLNLILKGEVQNGGATLKIYEMVKNNTFFLLF